MSFHLRLGLTGGPFPSDFSTETLYAHFLSLIKCRLAPPPLIGVTWLIKRGGKSTMTQLYHYFAPRKMRVFNFFPSLHHPNNRLKSNSVFYLTILNLVAKKLFLRRRNTGGNSPPPPFWLMASPISFFLICSPV